MKPGLSLSSLVFLALLVACGERESSVPDQSPDADEFVEETGLEAEPADEGGPDPATCAETAMTTVEINACAAAINRSFSDSVANVVAQKKGALDAVQAGLLDKVAGALDTLAEADAGRIHWQYIDGTIRGAMALSHEHEVRADFVRRVDTLLGRGELPRFSRADLDTLDAQLNKAYQGDLAKPVPDRKGYREQARIAQRQWLKYRDAWMELAAARFADTRDPDPVVAVQASLTRERILRICLGGDEEPPASCPCWVPGRDYVEGCPAE